MEMQDPEVNDLEVVVATPGTASVTGQVRIVRSCAECGNELREATFDIDQEIEIGEHDGTEHELEATLDDVEPIEETGSRYAKSYFGAQGNITITCSCKNEEVVAVPWSDKIQASGMDEIS